MSVLWKYLRVGEFLKAKPGLYIWDWVRRLYGWSFYYCSYWTLLLFSCYFTSDPSLTLWPFLFTFGKWEKQCCACACAGAVQPDLPLLWGFWHSENFPFLFYCFYFFITFLVINDVWTFSHFFIPISPSHNNCFFLQEEISMRLFFHQTKTK